MQLISMEFIFYDALKLTFAWMELCWHFQIKAESTWTLVAADLVQKVTAILGWLLSPEIPTTAITFRKKWWGGSQGAVDETAACDGTTPCGNSYLFHFHLIQLPATACGKGSEGGTSALVPARHVGDQDKPGCWLMPGRGWWGVNQQKQDTALIRSTSPSPPHFPFQINILKNVANEI